MGAPQYFEVVSAIDQMETIATGGQIRQLTELIEQYGDGRWTKMKGTATVRFPDATIRRAEIHWYEAHGVGKRRLKIKRFLD